MLAVGIFLDIGNPLAQVFRVVLVKSCPNTKTKVDIAYMTLVAKTHVLQEATFELLYQGWRGKGKKGHGVGLFEIFFLSLAKLGFEGGGVLAPREARGEKCENQKDRHSHLFSLFAYAKKSDMEGSIDFWKSERTRLYEALAKEPHDQILRAELKRASNEYAKCFIALMREKSPEELLQEGREMEARDAVWLREISGKK